MNLFKAYSLLCQQNGWMPGWLRACYLAAVWRVHGDCKSRQYFHLLEEVNSSHITSLYQRFFGVHIHTFGVFCIRFYYIVIYKYNFIPACRKCIKSEPATDFMVNMFYTREFFAFHYYFMNNDHVRLHKKYEFMTGKYKWMVSWWPTTVTAVINFFSQLLLSVSLHLYRCVQQPHPTWLAAFSLRYAVDSMKLSGQKEMQIGWPFIF